MIKIYKLNRLVNQYKITGDEKIAWEIYNFVDKEKNIDIKRWWIKKYTIEELKLYSNIQNYEYTLKELDNIVYLELFRRLRECYDDINEGYKPLLGYIKDTVKYIVREELRNVSSYYKPIVSIEQIKYKGNLVNLEEYYLQSGNFYSSPEDRFIMKYTINNNLVINKKLHNAINKLTLKQQIVIREVFLKKENKQK
ncbi:MAG: hypothetical protein ACOCRK_10535 [bacterium]